MGYNDHRTGDAEKQFFFQIPMIIFGQVTVFENIVFSSALVEKNFLTHGVLNGCLIRNKLLNYQKWLLEAVERKSHFRTFPNNSRISSQLEAPKLPPLLLNYKIHRTGLVRLF